MNHLQNGKFLYGLDYKKYQEMLSEVQRLGFDTTDYIPIVSVIDRSGIYTLIGVVNSKNGNNLIPSVFCTFCQKGVMGVLEGNQRTRNFCSCFECGELLMKCTPFRITERQLTVARLISEASEKAQKRSNTRRWQWWSWFRRG